MSSPNGKWMDRATWSVQGRREDSKVMKVTPMTYVPVPLWTQAGPHHFESPFPQDSHALFSPWEISDINRSTCLPYNPIGLRNKKDIVCMMNDELLYVIGARWKDFFFFCGALTVFLKHTHLHTHLSSFCISTVIRPAQTQGCVKLMDHIYPPPSLILLFHWDEPRACS